jgi:hypothetical protein
MRWRGWGWCFDGVAVVVVVVVVGRIFDGRGGCVGV